MGEISSHMAVEVMGVLQMLCGQMDILELHPTHPVNRRGWSRGLHPHNVEDEHLQTSLQVSHGEVVAISPTPHQMKTVSNESTNATHALLSPKSECLLWMSRIEWSSSFHFYPVYVDIKVLLYLLPNREQDSHRREVDCVIAHPGKECLDNTHCPILIPHNGDVSLNIPTIE